MPTLLIFCNSRSLGGSELLSIRLAAGLNQRGYSVTLVVPPHSPAVIAAQSAGVPTLDLKLGAKISSRNFLWAALRAPLDYRRLHQFFKQHAASPQKATVCFQFKKEQFLGTLAAYRLGLRVLWMEQGPLPRFMTVWPWNSLYRWAAQRADRIIAVSSVVQRSLEHQGLPGARIKVIYPAVPDALFDSEDAPAEGAKPTVGTVARLLRNKGIDDFIRAAVQVARRFPSAEFLIVGDGPERPWLERMAKNHPEVAIRFAGTQIPLAPWLRRMDVVVNSTVAEGEGTPLRLLEAMACARPVVSTDIGGCAETLGHGRYGRLVPARRPDLIAQNVSELLEDTKTRTQLGQEAQAWCRQTFAQDMILGQWMDLLAKTNSS